MATKKNKIELVHPQFEDAYLRLQDPEQSLELPLIDGQAASIRDVENGLFPPRGLHPDQILVEYTFKTWLGPDFRIQMMPMNVYHSGGGSVVVIGFWRPTQADGNKEYEMEAIDPNHEVSGEDRIFAVKYGLSGKRGTIVLTKNLLDAIEGYLMRDKLDAA